jgi:putative ABC transport system permease protein
MNISINESFRTSIDAVIAHRLRSLLTILGIVIGITTVVVVSSVLSGIRTSVVSFFQQLGPDHLFVFKSTFGPDPPEGSARAKERRRRPIKPEYADVIRRWCPVSVNDVAIELMVPTANGGNAMTLKVPGYEADDFSILAATSNANDLSPRDLREGRMFTPNEDARAARVAVIGAGLAEAMFPNTSALMQTVLLGGAEFTVVGVFEKAKSAVIGNNPQDNQIMMPLATARFRYPQLNNFSLLVNSAPGHRAQALDDVRAALRRVRNLSPEAPDDFTLSTPDQIVQQFDSITGLIGAVAIALSALGLLVGGIGVMNIMLISVTQRTREIGVRKALGARRRDIVFQFLVEAITLTGAGGILGILVSQGIALAVGKLVPALPMAVPAWAVVTGFGVSVAIGLFFGVWPATKAARLDPVAALRYE